jgi:hypothetical protein
MILLNNILDKYQDFGNINTTIKYNQILISSVEKYLIDLIILNKFISNYCYFHHDKLFLLI